MKYSAVIVTNSVERTIFTATHLMSNSERLGQLIVVCDMEQEVIHKIVNALSIQCRNRQVILNVRVGTVREVYTMFNEGLSIARFEHVLLLNDDMYMCQRWDSAITAMNIGPTDIVTFNVVEPGYVAVNNRNIEKNFGMMLEEFKQEEFENWVFQNELSSGMVDGLGWLMPVLFPKGLFERHGGYPTVRPFPFPNDITFFDKLHADPTVRFRKYPAYCYHFQRLSQRPDLSKILYDKLNLCCGDDKREGYLNCDVKDSDHNMDISDGFILFPEDTFVEVLFRHALEHFRPEIGMRLLSEIHRILKPGGRVVVHVPDYQLALEDSVRGYNLYPNCAPAIHRIYGLSTSEHQIHKWGYTVETLKSVLTQVGFVRTEHVRTDIVDEICVIAYV